MVPNNAMKHEQFHHHLPLSESKTLGRGRKLWENFELRSAKSEYNLSYAGRESRSGSRVNLAATSSYFNRDNRLDFASLNPATIDLSHEMCEQAIEELNFMAIFVRKLLKRTQAAGTRDLTDLLSQGINQTLSTLNAVSQVPASSSSSQISSATLPRQRKSSKVEQTNATLANPEGNPPVLVNLLVQYSDALLQIMQQRMTNGIDNNSNNFNDQQQTEKNGSNINDSNSSSSTNL